MPREQRKILIENIEKHRGSRLICCVTSDRQNAHGVIAKDFIPIFYNHLRRFEKVERVDTYIFTIGGDTLAAFGLSRLLREFAKHVAALVPEKCHSAGTLFALGANEIFMTRAATLSPIDPSIVTPLNPTAELQVGSRVNVPVSVENVAGFRELAREEWRLDDESAGAAFRVLADRINPLVLGQAYRSRKQIERLGLALLQSHRHDEARVKKIVQDLTRQLGSHDYLISREEARRLMGKQILGDDTPLEEMMWQLFEDFREEMSLGTIYDPNVAMNAARAGNLPLPAKVVNKLVIIESTEASDIWESQITLAPTVMPTPQGPIEVAIQQVVFNGWRHSK